MNDRRRSFVRRIFPTLGDNLDAENMAAAFDAECHPDVISGNRTAEDVRNELIEALGESVTSQAFEDYYDLQSITIDSDEQFEALVRSSWIAFIRQNAKRRLQKNKAVVQPSSTTETPKNNGDGH